MVRNRNFLAASVPGPSHLRSGIVCQDAFDLGYAGKDGEILVAAVADGLGSASLSDTGAKIATSVAVRCMLDAFESTLSTSEAAGDELLCKAFRQARKELAEAAKFHSCTIHDLATTLMLGYWKGDEFQGMHIGDGAIVLATKDGFHLYSVEEDQEYANEVYPLTANDWEAHLRAPGGIGSVIGFAMFTDGCQRAALSKRAGHYTPFPGFLDPLLQYTRELEASEAQSEVLARLLQSEKLANHCDDDKTLVLAAEAAR